jgi:hypothetical protein
MCDFGLSAALITVAATAATSYVSYQQSQQAAASSENQANYLSMLEQQRANMEAMQAQQIFSEQQAAQLLSMQYMMEDATRSLQNTDEEFNRQIMAMDAETRQVGKAYKEASSTALVRAAEGGVGGLSVAALLADYARNEYSDRMVMEREKGFLLDDYERSSGDIRTQLARAKESYDTQYGFDYNQLQRQLAANAMGSSFNMARINDPSSMSQRPNAFASFLTAAGGMASAANQIDYKGLNQALTPPKRTASTSKTSTRAWG